MVRINHKLLFVVTLTALLQSLNFTPGYAQAPAGKAYVVQADDWLSKLADKEYGDPLAYPVIVAATNAKAAEDDSFAMITNPDIIEIGQKIWIPASAEESAAAPPASDSSLTLEQLQNATYNGIYEESVQLTNGTYEGEPFVAGGASRPTVTFIDQLVARGDLNGDGIEDAGVLLVENSGGSGVFIYLAAVVNQDGRPVNAATTLLGDRDQIESLNIENGQIIVEMITQGPDDPMCCPTLKLRQTFKLEGDQLMEVGSEELGTVSMADLEGITWMLVDLNFDQQPALADTQVTVLFNGDKISGSAGCNDYNATVTSAGGQSLAIGPIASTKKACPEPIMAQEDDYLTKLQNVRQWQFLSGQLALIYQNEGRVGSLIFQPERR